MQDWTDDNLKNSPNKICVRTFRFGQEAESGDWINCDDFIEILQRGKKEVRSQKKFKERPAYIFFTTSDDYDLSLEFWGERFETDKEFTKRQRSVEEETERQKQRDLDRLKHLASGMGYDIVKKEIV